MRIRKPIATALTVAMLVVCMVGVAEAKKKRRLPTLAIGGRTIVGPATQTIPAGIRGSVVWDAGNALMDACATAINVGKSSFDITLRGAAPITETLAPLGVFTHCGTMVAGLSASCTTGSQCVLLYRIDAVR